HIASGLKRGFLERDVKRLATVRASPVDKARAEARFARSGRAGDQDGTTFIESLALKHCVEIRNAAGNALSRDGVVQPHRGAGQNGETAIVDEKRIFVGAVRSAAVFDDAHAARGNLLVY